MNSNTPDFKINYTPPINLDKDARHELGLLSMDMYHSIPNITSENCAFVYEYENEFYQIHVPTGSYEIKSINAYIQEQVMLSHGEKLFDIRGNVSTLKCVIEILKPDVVIIFHVDDSMKDLLGFTVGDLTGLGKHEGQKIIDIMTVNSVLIHCNIIEGSYLNQWKKPIIYSFFPNVPPGFKLVEEPKTVIYFPVTIPTINTIHIWFTDQNEKPITLRGETITMRLHLKSTRY